MSDDRTGNNIRENLARINALIKKNRNRILRTRIYHPVITRARTGGDIIHLLDE